MATGHLLDKALCPSCHFNELRHFLMAGKPTEGRGCKHHLVHYPRALECRIYEREPGTDDNP